MDDMGFPAGLARTMIADLTGRVPAGTRKIRIVTNLKIYWDRIRIANSAPNLPFNLHEVPLAAATLDFKGYPRVIEGNPLNDIRYVYEDISPTGPYTRQIGNYTRYGDVSALVQASDEKYAIYGSGDEVQVEFNPSNLPPLTRRMDARLLFLRRWLRQRYGFLCRPRRHSRPAPLPHPNPLSLSQRHQYPTDADHLKYLLNYNTRPVAGPPANAYRFQYSPPK